MLLCHFLVGFAASSRLQANNDTCAALNRATLHMHRTHSHGTATQIPSRSMESIYPFHPRLHQQLYASCANPHCRTPTTSSGMHIGNELALKTAICDHLLQSSAEKRRLQDSPLKPECLPMAVWGSDRTFKWANTTLLSNGVPEVVVGNFLMGLTDGHFAGEALASLTAGRLDTSFSIPPGYYALILRLVAERRVPVNGNAMPHTDPCSAYFSGPGIPPPRITFDVFIQKLTAVNEQDYQFSVLMWFIEIWADDRIPYLPPMTGEEAAACSLTPMMGPSNVCADRLMGWYDGNRFFAENVVEWEAVQGYPVFFMGPMLGNLVMKNSLVRATFNVNLRFRNFPYDEQLLTIVLGNMPGIEAQIGSTNWEKNEGSEDAPGWNIQGISGARSYKDGSSWFTYNESHQFHEANKAMTQSDASSMYTMLAVSLNVKRVSYYYDFNYVVPVVLLCSISWTAFLLNPDDISSRLGGTFTILLALMVYQDVINSSLPKTGVLTRLHYFILLSNVIVILAAVEALLVFFLYSAGV